MNFAIVTDAGTVTEIDQSKPLIVNGVQYCLDVYSAWDAFALAEIGVHQIIDDAIPSGKIATGSTLEYVNNNVSRRWILTDAPPPPVPEEISDRQFAQVLAIDGLITQDEALAWVKIGTVPAAIQTVVDAIPDANTRFAANMLLGGATVFERHHPMTLTLGAGLGKTSDDMDRIWQIGATL